MFAAVDVDYDQTNARAACVLFREWTDEHAAFEHVLSATNVAPYEPGAFYRRELPVLQSVLAVAPHQFHTVIVDGYVWLDREHERAGLGAHLHAALDGRVAVIGVAKTKFEGAPATDVLRGSSLRPLYVTSVGTDHASAVSGVRSMHGAYRMPTLLRRVDALARGRVHPA
jgi:deoxyribonuclease V